MQYMIAVLHQIQPRPGETLDQAATRTQMEIVERNSGTTLASSRPLLSHVDVEHDDEVVAYVGPSPHRRVLLEVGDGLLTTVPAPLRKFRIMRSNQHSGWGKLVPGLIEARDSEHAMQIFTASGNAEIQHGYTAIEEIE